jgi:hypothetical protein
VWGAARSIYTLEALLELERKLKRKPAEEQNEPLLIPMELHPGALLWRLELW